MSRNRIKDQIAIVGVSSLPRTRDGNRTARSLVAEACVQAIRDAGLKREDIDGIVSSAGPGHWLIVPPGVTEMTATLRLPNITYLNDGMGVVVSPLIDAMNAIFSGACETVLVYHYNYRTPFNSKLAAEDPFRRGFRGYDDYPAENVKNATAYTAWCARYMHENNVPREALGRVAINDRTNALRNPLAAMGSKPLTMEDYLNARMVRDPLTMFDMDLPVDAADAFILTTAERARDLPHTPVLISHAVQGLCETASDEDQLASLAHHGQDVVVRQLKQKGARGLADVNDTDIAMIYDGFTFISLSWYEKLGWCGPGEAGAFIEQNWNAQQNRLLLNGRIPVNTNGGMLSEGGTQGAGFVREAVVQLRGDAGERQVPDAKSVFLANGGFFYNSQAAVFRRDDS